MDTVQGGRTIYGGGEGADTKQDKTRHYTGGNEHYNDGGHGHYTMWGRTLHNLVTDTKQWGDRHNTRWTDTTQKWGTIHDGRDGHYSMGGQTLHNG